ncbi:MAG TPA: outer membrane protein assembly factor BamA [Gammaproteobacteria bacterium]|nr:outer membrane protein assembly factor BamA [Gammaproteobacteria bacterium]
MRAVACLALFLLCGAAAAFEPFLVRDIRVEGLQRITEGTVYSYLPLKAGDRMDESLAEQAVRELYKTGFFSNVRLARRGDVLLVKVTERPSIASIEISGNKEITTDDIKKSLKQIGLAEGLVFNRSTLERVEQELVRQYYNNGKYAVRVESRVTPLERNRVAIAIDIAEGEVARIRGINIVGNRAFTEERLLDQFELGPSGPFSFLSSSDKYSRQRLAGDLETLRSYYMDRGYIDFNITSTQVSITPDRRDVYITINVSEGDKFTIGDVGLEGELVLDKRELRKLIPLKPGDTFSRKEVTAAINSITERISNEGYAFANVNAIPEFDRDGHRVSLRFFVDPGKRVYVRRINIHGNTKTRDDVIRREMRQMEGGLLSIEKLNLSRRRLNRLGYFGQVNIETPAVPGTPDQVDVNVGVTEQPSGSFSAGIGYSQAQGALVNASINQNNFLGTGTSNSLTINNSRVNTIYSFSYTNPYYTKDGVSRGFRAFYRETNAGNANVARYLTDVYGGGINYGLPLDENNTFRFGLDYEHTYLKTTDRTPQEFLDFIQENGDKYDVFNASLGWIYDTRNRGLFPTDGVRNRLNLQIAIPGSTLDYYKVELNHKRYVPVGKRSTILLRGEVNYGGGMGDLSGPPPFEYFYSGGSQSVRGFQANSLGPRPAGGDPSDRSLGGTFETVAGIEYIFPPTAESESLRMTLFTDVGNVFAGIDDFDSAQLRSSYGVGLIWLTPVGVLKLSYARPLYYESGDDLDPIQFTIGVDY